MMTLQVDIRQDTELREYLKKYMKGVITSISREEVDAAITAAAVTKIDNMNMRDIRMILKENESLDMQMMVREKIGELTMDSLTAIVEGQVLEARRTSSQEIRAMVKREVEEVKLEIQQSFVNGLKAIGGQ